MAHIASKDTVRLSPAVARAAVITAATHLALVIDRGGKEAEDAVRLLDDVRAMHTRVAPRSDVAAVAAKIRWIMQNRVVLATALRRQERGELPADWSLEELLSVQEKQNAINDELVAQVKAELLMLGEWH